MAELGQQTVEFSALVGRAAEESFLSLKELVVKAKSTELSDTDKKVSLLKYVVKTQQRMLRLNALAKWCKQVCPFSSVCTSSCLTFWGLWVEVKVRSFLGLESDNVARLSVSRSRRIFNTFPMDIVLESCRGMIYRL